MRVTEILLNGVILAGIAGYALAWLLMLLRRRRTGETLLAAAWLATAAVFALNWMQAGEPPFGNMYHVQVVLALCFPPLFLFLATRRELRWTGVYFAFVSLLPMLGALFMDKEMHWRRMPALQSPWFVPHVTAYMIGYALATVAFVMAAAKWLRKLRGRTEELPAYDRAVREIVRISFPFMTFGLLSGALWAEEAWGAYWSWDPKETWALLTWTLYLIYLHCWERPDTRRWTDLANAIAFVALLTTFTLVNILPRLASGLHTYAR